MEAGVCHEPADARQDLIMRVGKHFRDRENTARPKTLINLSQGSELIRDLSQNGDKQSNVKPLESESPLPKPRENEFDVGQPFFATRSLSMSSMRR